MKAIVYRKYGAPDVLQFQEVDKPTPEKDEVLIKVHAAEASKADCELRSFNFAVQWFWLPLRIALGIFRPKRSILGGYFAGEIAAVGKDVGRWKAGDRVFGSAGLRLGAYAEYMCLPAEFAMAPLPHNTSFAEAAAVPLGGLNALHFLSKANIQPGEHVLINGAGGSIGTFAVQIARAFGAEVTAVDAPHKEAMLRRIGAAHFVDYTRENFAHSGQRYDVIFNMVAGSTYSTCIKALNSKGRYLMANPRLADMLRSGLTSAFGDKRTIFAFAQEREEELHTLKTMLEAGQIKATVDEIYPLEQAAEAHRRVETEQRLGSVVLAVAEAAD